MNKVNVDIIKSLKTLKHKVSKEQFDKLLANFGLSEDDFETRISGIDREYEFLCNLYLCNKVNHIIPIDEKFTTAIGEKSCDAIIELKNKKKIMIEVKSTNNEKYTISKGNFDKKVKWSKEQGFDLYFAINIFNYWTLFSSEQMNGWNRKIDISKLQYSLLSTILGVNYYVSTDLKMVSTYTDLLIMQNLNIYDTDKFHLCIKEQFYVNNKLVEEVTPENDYKLPLVLLSEALKSRSRMIKQKINEHIYTITYELEGTNIFSTFELYKETIIHMEGSDDEDKYCAFMNFISKDYNKRNQINTWLDKLTKLLCMIPLELLPATE